MFLQLLNKSGLGQQGKVLLGTSILFAIAGYPVITKEYRRRNGIVVEGRGAELFSTEKPQIVEENENKQERARR